MRTEVIACAIISIIILSQISEFCHGESDTIDIEAKDIAVDISDMSFQFERMGTYYTNRITLNGSWNYSSTDQDPQKYVVSYYRLGYGETNKSEILVVGEEYEWIVDYGSFLYLYFPDPGDISDNHGIINLTFKVYYYGSNLHTYWINVNASDNSVQISNAKSYKFPRGGEYELIMSGEWKNNRSNDTQNYTLAYYKGSDRIEKLVNGSKYLWNVSEGDSVYFFLPYLGIDTTPNGQFSIDISEINPSEGQMWCLTPVWIGIWLTIVSIIIGLIGIIVARKRR